MTESAPRSAIRPAPLMYKRLPPAKEPLLRASVWELCDVETREMVAGVRLRLSLRLIQFEAVTSKSKMRHKGVFIFVVNRVFKSNKQILDYEIREKLKGLYRVDLSEFKANIKKINCKRKHRFLTSE